MEEGALFDAWLLLTLCALLVHGAPDVFHNITFALGEHPPQGGHHGGCHCLGTGASFDQGLAQRSHHHALLLAPGDLGCHHVVGDVLERASNLDKLAVDELHHLDWNVCLQPQVVVEVHEGLHVGGEEGLLEGLDRLRRQQVEHVLRHAGIIQDTGDFRCRHPVLRDGLLYVDHLRHDHRIYPQRSHRLLRDEDGGDVILTKAGGLKKQTNKSFLFFLGLHLQCHDLFLSRVKEFLRVSFSC